MQSFHPLFFRQVRLFVLLAMLFSGTSSCQYIPFNISSLFNKEPSAEESQAIDAEKRSKIREIYIQNFSGQKVKEVQEIFFEAAKEHTRVVGVFSSLYKDGVSQNVPALEFDKDSTIFA
ncbi:MAG: hypothetical protein HN597_21370 [Desulfobacula sp.]|uniref:hypothetical protein n=1 Tax=Desulfobacula sp. TaxID=2593537 RepID=UPI0039B8C8E8|nr:hypothetical protein [Desulfobacula sp.]